ncbi:NAD(P)/FAD-dependent oxidoreductase [Prosthecomicrobium sp. N25]|uniref:NAD(P)/FAD-dependent oxidoreductase n=1 Tax=Prosthecomicrobium sp. N25 TaxID=3129254 RepID=UPI003076BC2E
MFDRAALDCAVVGGGPAGLTAALYLARYRRRVAVFDGGASRAAWIPCSHNIAGFPDGLSGPDLIARMRDHAERYGAEIRFTAVRGVLRGDGGFELRLAGGDRVRARTLMVATGVVDREPDLPNLDRAVRRGLVRQCPVCDGYEAIDRRLAVLGPGDHGAREALFLSRFSGDVTVMTLGGAAPDPGLLDALAARRIPVISARPERIDLAADGRIAALAMPDGGRLAFDLLYSALGVRPRNRILVRLGAALAADGRVLTDDHQRASVPGVYAAGDIVAGLNQVAVSTGQAAIAATAIHNDLD